MSDREKLINAIEKAKAESEEYAQDYIIVPFKEADMILKLLKEQPEIIRCKDCKYYRQNTIYPGTNAILTYCAITGVIRDDPCWSCTDGERKGDNG